MHGRVKVKTSAEQEAVKKKERAEKVRVYKEVTSKIYDKRAAGDHDEEALKLTRSVLTQNPEISTFWNYRREILLERFETQSPEESSQTCLDELSLLEFCLRVNPKAYCIWFHRQWIMTRTPSPNWKNEKALCDLFLKYDERNFHCWDYRRFVISKSPEVTVEEEFDFTYRKIADNFSNYSAWHYRSKLLPKLHPSEDKPGGVAEEALLKEHELVQNAFFTDPSDQSAWFYQRWLLGKVDKPLEVASVFIQRRPKAILFTTLNQPIEVIQSNPIEVTIGEAPAINVYDETGWPESMYSCSISSETEEALATDQVKVTVKYHSLELQCMLNLRAGENESWWLSGVGEIFGSSLTAATSSVLQSELGSCQELMEEEPENKWCILTVLLLMQALDAKKYSSQIASLLKKLCTVDSYRAAYYKDLLSKFVIEQTLKESLQQFSSSERTLNLRNKELSQLSFLEHMALYTSVDLSGNALTYLPSKVQCLVCVTQLNLDDNLLDQLPQEVGKLKTLKTLSLKNNKISNLKCLECLQGLEHLESLCLQGNPLFQSHPSQEEVHRLVTNMLPQLKQLI